MELNNYGVTLRRLTHDKIELVRQWRNHPKISRFMEYRDEITPEMQENWFKRIDNENNFYFLIVKDDKEIGLINIRDIDYEKKEGEGGIFIWDDDYLNSDVSFRAMLGLFDFFFDELQMKKMLAHILKDNKRAIQFNKVFGYKISSNQDDVYNQEYTVDFESYIKAKNKLIKYLN